MTAAGATVAVTGMGVVSCLGLGAATLLDACLAQRTGLTHDETYGCPVGRVSAATMAALEAGLRSTALAPYTRPLGDDDESRSKPALMTAYALADALRQAGVDTLDDTTGLIFATTTGHTASWEAALPRFAAGDLTSAEFATRFRHHHLGRSLDPFIGDGGFHGPYQVLTSACAAGTQALALAHSWLRSGKVRRCLVGATETLTELTMRGFGCLGLLSPDVAAPFARQRSGINLSEAAVFICLEVAAAPAVARLGAVLGGGFTMDAFDMTRPHPEGRGIHRAMTRALAVAELAPDAVDWLLAHGTGSPANDAAEAAAIGALFGKDRLAVCATKAVHGHALGASGLLEAVVALEAMRRGLVPPSPNASERDPSLAVAVTQGVRRCEARAVMKTTLGFGGVNAAVVLGPGAPA